MVKARHRRPSNTRKNVQRAVTVTGTTALALGATTFPAMANGPEAWDVIARCESGNKNIENAGPSTASGYFQIIDGTWVGAGGEVYAPRAIGASYDQQLTVAQEIASRRGSLADWNASIACWGDEITSAVPAFVAPAPAPAEPAPVEPTPEPVTEEVVTAGATYTVVENDTLIKIGAQVGKSWEELAALNGLVDPWTIFPGQVLKLEEDKVEYVVVEGDTLTDIGVELATPWQEIYEANVDTIGPNPDLILPGQVFIVGGLLLPQAPATVEESRPVEEETPVEATASGVIVPGATFTSEYGPRWGTMHNGIDLAAPVGTPIYAPVSGTVDVSGIHDSGGFGAVVFMTADSGEALWFGHIDTWLVNAGDRVEAGQQIATVGNRGQSTGPHLHFEVHIGPGPVNPVSWLAERGISF